MNIIFLKHVKQEEVITASKYVVLKKLIRYLKKTTNKSYDDCEKLANDRFNYNNKLK